ncbi:MAG: hypothetical protein MI919_19995 [Holophagales bacterium]|nr:hypothetical protein [Holophagales bacterium]
MSAKTARIVQWKEIEVEVREIPRSGFTDGEAPSGCEPGYALVYAGHGITNRGGSWTVSLPAISCPTPAPGGDRQPSVVATPTTDGPTDDIPRPYLLAVRTQGADVTVWSYDAQGELAGGVEFSWHCVVEGTLVQ